MLSEKDKFFIFQYFEKNNPNPVCPLYYTNAYTLLVAVVLSAQSTDKGVNKITPLLFEQADTPQKMLCLGEEKLKNFIKTIGLFQRKTMYILTLSQQIIELYNGSVPESRKDLEGLYGVGRKSANIILNICFDQPTIAVDTHVFRVAQRLGLAYAKTPDKLEQALLHTIPYRWHKNASFWLVYFGRSTCKAVKPLCSICPFKKICVFYTKKEK